MNFEKLSGNLESWARGAGAILRQWSERSDLEISSKSTSIDLVTSADRASESYLLERINSTYPDHDILSEESGSAGLASEWRWVIDPLDGTVNFAHAIPVYAVSIALQHQGSTVAGVVYNPVTDQLFRAVKGFGAYLNRQPIQVSAKQRLQDCVLATGFPYDRAENPDNNAAPFAAMVPRVRGLRRLGSAAYDLANVAAGRLDGYWELGLSSWDVAAGTLLVEEAGGSVLEWPGHRGVSIIAANPGLARTIRALLLDIDGIGPGPASASPP